MTLSVSPINNRLPQKPPLKKGVSFGIRLEPDGNLPVKVSNAIANLNQQLADVEPSNWVVKVTALFGENEDNPPISFSVLDS
ncbi:MAG: hypothetical protein PHC64_02995, partial [Candidatus Gastranaerophilales bacterium]|nr:hypothetical protein [Candidatus Gastranaerophilales bacterium]